MNPYFIVLILLIIHYIADYVFQPHRIGANKWNNFDLLTEHVFTYTIIFWFIGTFSAVLLHLSYNDTIKVLYFCIITFICHLTTDYFTSKWTHRLYEEQKYHNFFLVLGFDQLLHFTQIILTYYFLIK